MRKLLQKLKAFWERKGYEPHPTADIVWAQAQTIGAESDIDSVTSNSIAFPEDVIEEMKKAKREVEAFEKTLQSLKQNETA